MNTLEVLYTPADFAALKKRSLDRALCVVLDIFRATTSMVTALANGAGAVIPVGEIPEALALRDREPHLLLAGERDGLRIRAQLTGGVDFDLGNSPIEFTREKVAGKTIAMTTTNGTRALRAAAHARTLMIACFLNLRATADAVRQANPDELVIVCSGTIEQSSYEDVLAAGALSGLLWNDCAPQGFTDGALMAKKLFEAAKPNLLAAASESRNGHRLLSRPELRADVPYCLQQDLYAFGAALQPDGRVIKL
jgi:2-phosphosulfolactate phosphatase